VEVRLYDVLELNEGPVLWATTVGFDNASTPKVDRAATTEQTGLDTEVAQHLDGHSGAPSQQLFLVLQFGHSQRYRMGSNSRPQLMHSMMCLSSFIIPPAGTGPAW
jgi:hypothetical protein